MNTTVVALSLSAATAAAHGQIWLSGVVGYGANGAGSTLTEPAEYDNIVGTGNFEVALNGQPRGTTFLLSDGLNNFTFAGMGAGYNALSLYFAPTGAAFNRPFGSLPDLVVFGDTTAGTPIPGALVQTNGQFSGAQAWTGAGSYTVGDRVVTVTQFTAAGGAGTFTINVTPTPGAAAVFALASLGALRRRR